MGAQANDWGWPDARTGKCAAFSGRIDENVETQPGIDYHSPLSDADVGVNVAQGGPADSQLAGMPGSVMTGSSPELDRLNWLARESFERVQEPTMQVARDLRDPIKVLGRSRQAMDWQEFERRKQELHACAVRIWEYWLARRQLPYISRSEYNELFRPFVQMLVSYFREMGWHHSAEAYAKYLNVEPVNTDIVRIPFSEVKALMMDIPEVQDVFTKRRTEAKRYACTQPFSNPQPKTLGKVEMPDEWGPYAQHVDVGLVLGHFAVSARVAPRGPQGPMRMAWQLYFEVTAESARFDFDDPAKTLRLPRRVGIGLYTEVPAVIFWAAEVYTGAAQPYPVYSHEFSEIFICKCERVK